MRKDYAQTTQATMAGRVSLGVTQGHKGLYVKDYAGRMGLKIIPIVLHNLCTASSCFDCHLQMRFSGPNGHQRNRLKPL